MTKKRRIICETLDEAKKEVLKLVEQGASFRDIVQIEFQIGDGIKHFSIGEISKIKNGSIVKIDEFQNKYQDTSFLFMLFDKGRHPIDIVIEYKLDPDYVQKAYTKYGEMKNMYLIPMSIKDKIFDIAVRISGQTPVDIEDAFKYVDETAIYYFWSMENEEE